MACTMVYHPANVINPFNIHIQLKRLIPMRMYSCIRTNQRFPWTDETKQQTGKKSRHTKKKYNIKWTRRRSPKKEHVSTAPKGFHFEICVRAKPAEWELEILCEAAGGVWILATAEVLSPNFVESLIRMKKASETTAKANSTRYYKSNEFSFRRSSIFHFVFLVFVFIPEQTIHNIMWKKPFASEVLTCSCRIERNSREWQRRSAVSRAKVEKMKV